MSLTEKDVETIRGTTATHQKAHLARDWDTWVSTCAEDVIFMPPDSPKIEGKRAVRAWMDEFPTTRNVAWSVEAVEGSGETGSLAGRAR